MDSDDARCEVTRDSRAAWLRERGRTGDYAPVTCPTTTIEIEAALQVLRAALQGKTWSTLNHLAEESMHDRQV
jgi:hypothetical protein